MAYHVLDGKGTTQIARELGLGVKTVDNVISRAKARCAAGAGVEELMRAVVVQKRSGRPRGRRGAGGGGGGGGGPGGEGPGLRDDEEEEREGRAADRGGQEGLVYGDEQVYRILQESQDVGVSSHANEVERSER